jgi:uncharacterized protein YdeI (YjbR/CyaY-like superfamily)
MKNAHQNTEVSKFLDRLNHPLRNEIEELRSLILSAEDVQENIKWNGPNYTFNNEDRITMKIQPLKQIQLIFHRGAKKLEQPKDKLIDDKSKILTWKENDRAIIGFKNLIEIENTKSDLIKIIKDWISASK